jgi:hypothetical protein
MLPLDHIPFPSPDLAGVASAFEGLGFTVSPPGVYTAPSEPGARWPCRCVFMAEGWFDLLHAPQAPADGRVRPAAALFRTDDLEAAAARLHDMRLQAPYLLERRWDDEPDLGVQAFSLIPIRERISPLPLSVIAHSYPAPTLRNAWFDHRNRALEVAGLVFCGGEPGAFARAAGRVLDLGGFAHWPTDVFAARFGDADVAIQIRTASLQAVRQALSPNLPVMETAGTLCLRPPAPLDCGFQFFESVERPD